MVIVRAFADDDAIRLTIEDRSGKINQQLLINRNALAPPRRRPRGDIATAVALSSA